MQFRQKPDPANLHLFIPRKHGSKVACEVCGGTQWDRIHDVPRRRLGDGRPV
jgi:hypothetical protein